jgi:hypothetical protein
MTYELIREIFNKCPGNQMRDVFVSEIETDNPDDYVKTYFSGVKIDCEKSLSKNGGIVYNIITDNLRQRLTFS